MSDVDIVAVCKSGMKAAIKTNMKYEKYNHYNDIRIRLTTKDQNIYFDIPYNICGESKGWLRVIKITPKTAITFKKICFENNGVVQVKWSNIMKKRSIKMQAGDVLLLEC